MNKSTRLNQELIFLNARKSFQLKDLMETFDISKRTALRDLQELETLGLPLYSVPGRYGGYRIIDTKLLPPLYFNFEEITAIFFALKALEQLYTNPFQQLYTSITQKLMLNLSKVQQEAVYQTLNVTHYYNPMALKPAHFLPELLQAIIDEKQVALTYSQYELQTINVQFFDLFYREGVWFTHAINIENKKWGVYRCDFMESFTVLETKDNLSRHQLELSLQAHNKSFRSIYFKCKISEFGKELFQKNHYETMKIEILDNQAYLTGYYNESEINYLVHYLIEFGEHIKIESPESLKISYIDQLKTILNRYEAI